MEYVIYSSLSCAEEIENCFESRVTNEVRGKLQPAKYATWYLTPLQSPCAHGAHCQTLKTLCFIWPYQHSTSPVTGFICTVTPTHYGLTYSIQLC